MDSNNPLSFLIIGCGKLIVSAGRYQSVLQSAVFTICRNDITTKKETVMIRLVNQLVGVVLVGAITGGVALAKEIKKQVTFSESFTVNGTAIKQGTYQVVFDDQTNELSIVKDRKVIARTPAQLEKRGERDHSVYEMRQEVGSTNAVLLRVGLNNRNQATIVNSDESAQ